MSDERISVFLADDHQMVRECLAAMLSREGDLHVVGECGDGLTALEQIQQVEPDVAVLDIRMPGLNGIDLCRELKRKVKGTSLLLLTMYDDVEFIARALRSGATGYLMKEAGSECLIQAIRTVARGELYLGPGIPQGVLDRIHSGDGDLYERLSTRERQVLQIIAEGNTNRKVAEVLGLSVKTIDTHRMRIMKKLDIHDQVSLVKFAVRKGLVE